MELRIEHSILSGRKTYTLVYTSDHPMRFRYFKRGKRGYEKCWPRTTTCKLLINDTTQDIQTVVKHDIDPDNLPYAIRAVTKKVIVHVLYKHARKDIWDKISEMIDTRIYYNEEFKKWIVRDVQQA